MLNEKESFKAGVTVTLEEDQLIAVLSAAEEVLETYRSDSEVREDWAEWLEDLANGVEALNKVLYPES